MLRKLISIEGNIGSGKSTLLKILTKKFPEIRCIDQPLQDWMDSDLLSLYYKDQNRWALTFQTYCLFSRIRAINKPNHANLMISERSIEADREIFAKLLRNKGLINQTEWKLYESYFNGFQEELHPKKVDTYLYLRTKPQICYDRILKRARSQQGIIPLQYLKDLNQRHESWLLNNPEAIILDGNQEFEHSTQIISSLIKQIQEQLQKKLSFTL